MLEKNRTLKFVEHFHSVASKAGDVRLCLCGFGEGMPPVQKFFDAGDIEGMIAEFHRLSEIKGLNIYMSLAVFSKERDSRKRDNQMGVLGFVVDFDDDDAENYLNRLPLKPDMVLETSKGRYQAFYMLSEPLMDMDMAEAIADFLKLYSGADHCTSDVSHVWRMPETMNFPNAKKISEGRSPDGEPVRVHLAWDGHTTTVQGLWESLQPQEGTSTKREGRQASSVDVDDILCSLPVFVLEKLEARPEKGKRSDHIYNTLRLLQDNNVTESQALCLAMRFKGQFIEKFGGDVSRIQDEVGRVYAKGGTSGASSSVPSSSSEELFKSISELDSLPPIEYIIDGVVPSGALLCFSGQPGIGKSLLALDMMASIAAGRAWDGKHTRQGNVLYLCAEGVQGFKKRRLAWEKHHGVKIPVSNLFYASETLLLDTEEGENAIVAGIEAYKRKHGTPSVLVIDTLSRTISEDENAAGVMTKYVAAVTRIIQKFGCSAIIIHHPPKGNNDAGRASVFRGHSSLFGALDTAYSLKKEGSYIVLCNEKMKDDEPPEIMHFQMVTVDLEAELGKKRDGTPVTGVVLERINRPTHIPASGGKLGKYHDMPEALVEMMESRGGTISLAEAVTVCSRRYGGGSSVTAIKQAVSRCFQELEGNQSIVKVSRGLYQMTNPPAEVCHIESPDDLR